METSEIEIAGKKFPVKPFVFAKNRKVVPAVSFALNAINDSATNKNPINITAMDNMYLAVYEAVTQTLPDLKRAEFDEWTITLPELAKAMVIIAQATGILVKGDSPQGEGTGP